MQHWRLHARRWEQENQLEVFREEQPTSLIHGLNLATDTTLRFGLKQLQSRRSEPNCTDNALSRHAGALT